MDLNVRVRPVHIPGVDNVLADPLSRGDWPAFASAMQTWLGQQGFAESPFVGV